MSCRHDLALGTCKVCYPETGSLEPEGDGDSLDGPGAVDRDGVRLPLPPILTKPEEESFTPPDFEFQEVAQGRSITEPGSRVDPFMPTLELTEKESRVFVRALGIICDCIDSGELDNGHLDDFGLTLDEIEALKNKLQTTEKAFLKRNGQPLDPIKWKLLELPK